LVELFELIRNFTLTFAALTTKLPILTLNILFKLDKQSWCSM